MAFCDGLRKYAALGNDAASVSFGDPGCLFHTLLSDDSALLHTARRWVCT
jgi:hypothetical protein